MPLRLGLPSGAFSSKPVKSAGSGAGATGGAGGGVVGAGAGAADAAVGATFAPAHATGGSSAPPQATIVRPLVATISTRKINRFMTSLTFRETCGVICPL